MADGSVTIECIAKTDKFDKEMAKIEKQIDKKEKENVKINITIANYEEQIRQFEELGEKAEEYRQKLIASGKDTGSDTKLKEMTKELDKQYLGINKLENKIVELRAKQADNTQEATYLRQQLDMVKINKQKAGVEDFKNSLESVGKSIGRQIKQMGRLALGIFGVRSAYMLLRQASSTIGQYDEQYAANLEYIRYALAMSIKPVLEYIVNLAAQLLQYVNYIASVWFGLTGGIFKSADAFKDAKKSLGGMAASAKEVNKQLAGFDEMTVLSDNKATGGARGGGAARSWI